MMDQRELDARVKALTKTIAANEPASNALSLLKTLKDETAPTEEMLRVRITRQAPWCDSCYIYLRPEPSRFPTQPPRASSFVRLILTD